MLAAPQLTGRIAGDRPRGGNLALRTSGTPKLPYAVRELWSHDDGATERSRVFCTCFTIDLQRECSVKYAIVDGERAEARPRLRGVCQCCGGQTITKCGEHVVWHWSHRRREDCDPWWETETEWHRSWKDRFPLDWQEVAQFDPATGEKHIADVKTPHGLVVEIQNSPIRTDEMQSREEFYRKLVWIVNGDRRGADGGSQTLDRRYFNMGRSGHPIRYEPLAFSVEWLGKSKLLHNWSKAAAEVFIDFGDGILWRLDGFEPNKIIVLDGASHVGTNAELQGELFTNSESVGKIHREINRGVFTPMRIRDFVRCIKKGESVTGGFGLDDLGMFKKELVPVNTLGSRVSDKT